MAVEKSDVLSALARVTSPDGVALPATGKLSDVIVTDGKVFFSITVDAAPFDRMQSHPAYNRAMLVSKSEFTFA